MGKTYTYILPTIYDQDNNYVRLKYDTKPFIGYSSGVFYFTPLPEDEGSHVVSVNLTDEAFPRRTKSYKFTIYVSNPMK